jgi:hypothetical protein
MAFFYKPFSPLRKGSELQRKNVQWKSRKKMSRRWSMRRSKRIGRKTKRTKRRNINTGVGTMSPRAAAVHGGGTPRLPRLLLLLLLPRRYSPIGRRPPLIRFLNLTLTDSRQYSLDE